MSLLTGIKFVSHEITSPFFTPSKEIKGPPSVLNASPFYSKEDGKYLVTNCAARIEANNLFSNIYFNNSEKSGI